MKFRFLWLSAIAVSSHANNMSSDTLTFSANNPLARQISSCEVIHEKLYGTNELSRKFKTYALFQMSMKGMEQDLTSNQLAEYNFGYEYNKNYWKGWFGAMEVSSKDTAVKVMDMMYSDANCTDYIK